MFTIRCTILSCSVTSLLLVTPRLGGGKAGFGISKDTDLTGGICEAAEKLCGAAVDSKKEKSQGSPKADPDVESAVPVARGMLIDESAGLSIALESTRRGFEVFEV